MNAVWRIGIEVELIAPPGLSRRTLAEQLARDAGGSVRPFFFPQSELSLVPGSPVFDNLTLGFEVLDRHGEPMARCVDDVTLQDDLDHSRAPLPGWFRVVSDERRLLHLVARTGRADAGPLEALAPIAALFGTRPEVFPEGMVRVRDESHAPIAIAMPLPGERERTCEIVTPPLGADRAERLQALLAPAQALGFRIARESATHIHFDAAPLRCARTLARLVRFFERWGPALRQRVGTNPACKRLGNWPAALHETIAAPDFESLSWPEAQERLQTTGLTKYCDFNLKNLVHDTPDKPTFEVRILPGLSQAEPILQQVALFETILRQLLDTEPSEDWTLALLGRTALKA